MVASTARYGVVAMAVCAGPSLFLLDTIEKCMERLECAINTIARNTVRRYFAGLCDSAGNKEARVYDRVLYTTARARRKIGYFPSKSSYLSLARELLLPLL